MKRIILVGGILTILGVSLWYFNVFDKDSSNSSRKINRINSVVESSQTGNSPEGASLFSKIVNFCYPSSKKAASVQRRDLAQNKSLSPIQSRKETAPEEKNSDSPIAQCITADGKTYEVGANSLGLFPRIYIQKNSKTDIQITYPTGAPGDVIVMQANDGGKLDFNTPLLTKSLSDNKTVSFSFTASEEGGVYRVTVRKAGSEKYLDFWVGKDLTVNQ